MSASENSTLRNCAELFVETEKTIIAADVIDSQDVCIAGYPYLRVNRFLSDYRYEVSGPAFESWINRLQELAIYGWQVELMNLPANARLRLQNLVNTTHPSDTSLIKALHTCGNVMRNKDLDEIAEQNKFREKTLVPAEYQTWQRIAGLYPLTAHFHFRKCKNAYLTILHRSSKLIWHQRPIKSALLSGRAVNILSMTHQNPLFTGTCHILE